MVPWRTLHPFIVLLGLVVSYWALRRRYTRSALSRDQKTAIGLAAFIGAMLGAKIPFLLGTESASESWLWLADGKTILGGILGGYLAVEATKPMMGIRERTGDHFAIPIAIAIGFGRLGCFVSGCCYGQVTDVPWGVHFLVDGDSPHILRHPTQLYEAVFHFLAVAGLLILELRGWLSGRRLSCYLLVYLAYRFVTEWIRPEPQILWGLTSYQLACIALAALLLAAESLRSRS